MTKTEPVVLFSGLAAVVGLGLHWLLPGAAIPDELIVAVVFVIALIARQFVAPSAKLPDADVLEHARRAVAARRGGKAAALLLALLLAPSWAAASSSLHCEEWPHWREAYDNIFNYDHRGGEAVEWLQLAGCPPVWVEDSQRWLPNGSDCDAPCEMAEERVRVALTDEKPALEATIRGGCAPECTTEPADVPAAADHRREPLTFTVRLDTRRDVIEEAAPGAGGEGDGEPDCSCTLQVQSGSAGQCYAPDDVTPDEWTHTTTLGDARAVWLSPQRTQGEFQASGRGQMRMSFLLAGARVQCEVVRVVQTPWQRFVGVVTDPRVLVPGGACALSAVFGGGALCGF